MNLRKQLPVNDFKTKMDAQIEINKDKIDFMDASRAGPDPVFKRRLKSAIFFDNILERINKTLSLLDEFNKLDKLGKLDELEKKNSYRDKFKNQYLQLGLRFLQLSYDRAKFSNNNRKKNLIAEAKNHCDTFTEFLKACPDSSFVAGDRIRFEKAFTTVVEAIKRQHKVYFAPPKNDEIATLLYQAKKSKDGDALLTEALVLAKEKRDASAEIKVLYEQIIFYSSDDKLRMGSEVIEFNKMRASLAVSIANIKLSHPHDHPFNDLSGIIYICKEAVKLLLHHAHDFYAFSEKPSKPPLKLDGKIDLLSPAESYCDVATKLAHHLILLCKIELPLSKEQLDACVKIKMKLASLKKESEEMKELERENEIKKMAAIKKYEEDFEEILNQFNLSDTVSTEKLDKVIKSHSKTWDETEQDTSDADEEESTNESPQPPETKKFHTLLEELIEELNEAKQNKEVIEQIRCSAKVADCYYINGLLKLKQHNKFLGKAILDLENAVRYFLESKEMLVNANIPLDPNIKKWLFNVLEDVNKTLTHSINRQQKLVDRLTTLRDIAKVNYEEKHGPGSWEQEKPSLSKPALFFLEAKMYLKQLKKVNRNICNIAIYYQPPSTISIPTIKKIANSKILSGNPPLALILIDQATPREINDDILENAKMNKIPILTPVRSFQAVIPACF